MVWRRSGFGVGFWMLASCVSTQDLLVKRFSREHSCQVDQVRVREAGGTTYIADGCGQHAEYVCGTFAGSPGSEGSCAERGIRQNADAAPPKQQYFNKMEPPK